MFESVSRFFLNAAFKKNRNKERIKKLPSENQNLLIVMIDEVQKLDITSIENKLKTLFIAKQIVFVVVNLQKIKGSDSKECFIEITLKDFNFFGKFNSQKSALLSSQNADLLINLIDHENIYINYLASVINSSFKITFVPRIEKIYDIIINASGETDCVRKIEHVSKYLKALNGNTNEDK